MRQHLILLSLIILSFHASAGHSDSTRVAVPTITYHSLDSLIRTNDLTAVFLWPGWCSGCRAHVPAIWDVLRQKKSITLISINDPESRPFLPKSLIDQPDVIKGYYRIQRYGREKMIAINDMTQFKYFYWYFTKEISKAKPQPNEYFLLFDRTGKLLYRATNYFNADTLAKGLAQYR